MDKLTLPALALIVFCGAAYAADTAAPAAPAATAPTAADCTALEKKFDGADKSHVTADKLKKANAKRSSGASQCTSGKVADGVKSLKSALKLIGAHSA